MEDLLQLMSYPSSPKVLIIEFLLFLIVELDVGNMSSKALAQGADVVAVGRPVLYGLNLGGAKGVQSVFEHLNKELSITMQLAGTKNIEEIKHTSLIA